MELEDLRNGETLDPHQSFDDIDSSCSTPYVSAPSSPGRGGAAVYYFSAPASPTHFVLSSSSSNSSCFVSADSDTSISGSFEFEFTARSASPGTNSAGSMISADELFFNGQIRPMKLSSHLGPLLNVEEEEGERKDKHEGTELASRGRDSRQSNRSMRRRTRSMSPLRNAPFHWQEEDEDEERRKDLQVDPDLKQIEIETPTPSGSASSSRSSSSGRNSKKWIFLKDLLYRSKSEGREKEKEKEKYWYTISFSKEKPKPPPPHPPSSSSPAPTSESQKQKNLQASGSASSKKSAASSSSKPTNGVGKRRVTAPSAHERHYTAKRAQAEEMRKKTFLPYRHGLLGCLGFSSRSYGAMNGFARTLNPVSSR